VQVVRDAYVSTFGPETAFDGNQIESNTRFEFDPKDRPNNKLDESVFFKFDIPTYGKYRIFVDKLDPAQSGKFLLAVNIGGGDKRKIDPNNAGGHSENFLCLDPGIHVASVRAYVEVAQPGGTVRLDPATRPFTFRVEPVGACTP
jgi:hypothetical protein